ncbi:MAG: hypothetical protein KIT31_03265 [Deltaproteobacteria bacterium]|nr:hypothetical protein [Deltaproteobacteria bacterium]
MRRWVISLGVLLVVGGVALVGAREWFVAELERHRDVLFLGMIGGESESTETVLAVALWGGIALVAGGVVVVAGGVRVTAEREVPIGLVIATATVGLLIAIPAAMFAVELGRKRNPAVGVPVRRTGEQQVRIANPIGCADGERDGFADFEVFPRIAACAGVWVPAASLRKPATGSPCGGEVMCASPADLCATGWHICSSAQELAVVSAEQCAEAGEGQYLAAMSSSAAEGECDPGLVDAMPCRERGANAQPVCCGEGCVDARCRDAVWKGATAIASSGLACGASAVAIGDGVLCCPN